VVLRDWRQRRGLSQEELAARAGISKSYVQGLEGGWRSRPSMSIVERLAAALNIPVTEFQNVKQPVPALSDTLRALAERCTLLETVEVPVRGTVPGEVRGQPVEYIAIPRRRIQEGMGDVYALEVTEAMPEEGIDIGDYVIVVPGAVVGENGGVFVLGMSDGLVLRRARSVGTHLHVQPEIEGRTVFPAGSIEVIGRVVLGGRWRDF